MIKIIYHYQFRLKSIDRTHINNSLKFFYSRLLNEIQWLNDELEKKCSQFLKEKSESVARAYESDAKIDELTAENGKLRGCVDNLQKANESMESQVEDLARKLQELREKFAVNKIDFESEAESREKLLQMYKEENARARNELSDAERAIGEFQHIIGDLKEEYARQADEKKMNETAYEV